MAPIGPLLGARTTQAALLAIRGGGGDASALLGVAGATAALTKAVVGLGVLTLANGISSGTGVGPATIAMATTTAVGAYTFSLVGEVCDLSGLGAASTFQNLWVASMGASSLWLLQSAIVSLCFSLCTVYLLCLGELLPPLFTLARAPIPLRFRRPCVLVGAAAVLPLCLQSSLSGLSFASLLGASAVAFTCLFLVGRWLDGSYARGGRFFDQMPPALQANVEGSPTVWQVSRETSILVANLGTALCAHYIAPSFYRTLAAASVSRFRIVTFSAFSIVLLISLLHALPGFFTFGKACQPLLLNNYHPTDDQPATAARAATAASLICSFPFMFMGLREALLPSLSAAAARLLPSLAPLSPSPSATWLLLTLIVGAPIVGTALLIENLGLVVGLMGSVLGGALMYVVPAAMHAACLLGPLDTAGGGVVARLGAATAAAAALPAGRRVALLADIVLVLYGAVGQMLVGTAVIYNYAREKKAAPPPKAS